MTYGELLGLFERLMSLGVLEEDDVVMRFIQQPGVDFACPFLFAMRPGRLSEIIRQAAPGAAGEDIGRFIGNSSVKAVLDQIKSKYAGRTGENIGLLDFKDASKPESEKFGGYFTSAGILHHRLQKQGLTGNIDGPEETNTAVFGFRVFNGKWIPIIAKLPEDADGARALKVPEDVKEKLSAYFGKLKTGDIMACSLSAMDPDVVEFLEITKNPRLYDGKNSLSGS